MLLMFIDTQEIKDKPNQKLYWNYYLVFEYDYDRSNPITLEKAKKREVSKMIKTT